MKKVIHLLPSLGMGGAETLVKEYCLGIDKLKFQMVIVCLQRLNVSYEYELEKSGVKIIYISDIFKKNILKNKILKLFLTSYLLKKICIKEKVDIVHSHLNVNRYIIFSNIPKNIKIIHTVHNEPNKLWKTNLRGKFDKICLNIILKKYDTTFIVLHDDMKKEIEEIFNTSNVIVLNNGIDFTKYEKLPSKKNIREKNNIPQNAFLIGHIGRFDEQKNHKFLINVFEEFLKINEDSHLLLIGTGDLKEDVIKLLKDKKIENKTTILSNRSDVPELLKSMDCFVFPSLFEGLGIVLIEAQKSGLKTIISDVIPKYAIISNLVKRISLEKSAKYWANEINSFNVDEVKYFNLQEWNMKNVIEKLEKIYMEE